MHRVRVMAALVALGAAAAAARADVDFYTTFEFSGGTAPAGPGPWLHAHFTDVSGGVDVTLTSLLSGPTEFVSEWMFNLDPALNPSHLSFSLVSGSALASSITAAADGYKADGDGNYDILFSFPTAPPASRFDASASVTYKITSTDPITAASFDFLSAPAGGHGPYPTAAHVQGTGGGGYSGWVTTPEPASALLLAIGGLMLAGRRHA